MTNNTPQTQSDADGNVFRFAENPQFDLIQETACLPVWDWNTITNQVFTNSYFASLLGLPKPLPALDFNDWLDIFHPDDKIVIHQSLSALKSGQTENHDLELRLKSFNQAYIHARQRARVVARDSEAQTMHIWGTLVALPDHQFTSNFAQNYIASPIARISEKQNQEIALLNWLVEMLQLCSTADEAFEVIASILKRLFPQADGLLAQPNQEPDQLQVVLKWGSPTNKSIFFADECWALRRKFIHSVGDSNDHLRCKHILQPFPVASICFPLIVQEEIIGLFHLSHKTDQEFLDPPKMQLVQAIADSSAVAMDNIHLRETLRQQSIRDPLTRLFNRRYMEETLEREIKRAKRSGYPLGILLLDIDYFKRVNDEHGHQAGDIVLRDIGQLLLSHTRADDVACRYGGEEFLIILPNITDEDLGRKAIKLKDTIKDLEWTFGTSSPTKITISLGTSIYPFSAVSSQELIELADRGLYQAKAAGRDQIGTALKDKHS